MYAFFYDLKIITDLDIELLDIYEYRYRPGIDGVNGVACIVCLSKTSTFFFYLLLPRLLMHLSVYPLFWRLILFQSCMLDPSRSFSATQSVLYCRVCTYGASGMLSKQKKKKKHVLDLEIYGLLAATAL